jgi:hypothetical protein
MRKNIDISESAVKVLDTLAVADNRPTKNYIETQIEFLCKKNINAIDLWNQCEAVTKQLQQLSK